MKYSLHSSFALVLSACALATLPAALSAQEKPSMQSKPFPEKLAALLDDETLCVVHVDFTRIDTDAVLNNTRAFVDKLLDKLGLSEADRDCLRTSLEPPGADAPLSWNRSKDLTKAGKAFLVDSLGVREAFLVVQTGGKSFPALVWAAIPKHDKLNVPMLSAMLKDKYVLIRESDDFCFIAMLSASLAGHVNLANVGPNRAAARPEFLEAYQVMKDYPVQVLIAPPKYVKRVFRETKPTLPGALEKFDIASMPDALRWAAIGVNPEKLAFLVVAEAESENDAQSLYRNSSDLFSLASKELISFLRKYKETPDEFLATLAAHPETVNEEHLKQLGQFLIPKPEGRQFVVKGNGDTLQTVVDMRGAASPCDDAQKYRTRAEPAAQHVARKPTESNWAGDVQL
jgi:hypothetical protein